MCNMADDPMLMPICEQSLLNAAMKDQNFRQKFNFSIPETIVDMRNIEKPNLFAFGSWIRRFQLDNGSIAAHDYAFSFVKVCLLMLDIRFVTFCVREFFF